MKKFLNRCSLIQILICIYMFVAIIFPGKYKLVKGIGAAELLLAFIFVFYLGYNVSSLKRAKLLFSNIVSFIKKPFMRSLLALLVIMAVSTTYSQNKTIALTETLRFFSYIAVGFLIVNEFKNEADLKQLYNTLLFATLLLGILGILQYFTKFGASISVIIAGKTPRIEATMGNPNSFGAYLVIVIFPIIMLCLYERENKRKLFYISLALLTMVNLIMTLSRNAWLSFFTGLFALVFIYNWRFVYFIAAALGTALFIPQVYGRILQFKDMSQNDGRIKVWNTALKMIQEHPLIGVGNGNFVVHYNSYVDRFPELRIPNVYNFPTHNAYLKLQSELGILGTLAFVLVLFFLLKDLLSLLHYSSGYYKYFYTGIFVSALCMLVLNFFDNILFVPQAAVPFWILIFTAQAAKGKAFLRRAA
jgi:putative inorganic carbon (hco3(-)) transporter